MRVRTPKLRPGVFLWALAACQGAPAGVPEDLTPAPLTRDPATFQVTTVVDGTAGGLAQSLDGLFSVAVQAGTHDGPIAITVATLETSPLTRSALSRAYRVDLFPADLDLGPKALIIGFAVDAPAPDAGTPTIVAYPSIPANLDRFLPRFEPESRLVTAEIHFPGSFVARSPCDCDADLACDQGCTCDEDCVPDCGVNAQHCDVGQCVPESYQCDGFVDCVDGSDEDGRCEASLPPDAFEPNDGFGSATLLVAGEAQVHSLHHPRDEDVVRFRLPTWANVGIFTSGPAGDTFMTLYDGKRNVLAENDDANHGFAGIEMTSMPPGDYFARIYEFGKNSALPTYEIALDVDPIPTPLLAPTGLTAYAAGDALHVAWDSAIGAVSYRLYYDDDSSLPADPAAAADEGASPVAVYGSEATLSGLPLNKTYWVRVASVNMGGTESPMTDAAEVFHGVVSDAYESDNTKASASLIEAGETQLHSFHEAGDIDFITFTLAEASSVRVRARAATVGDLLNVVIFDDLNREVASDIGRDAQAAAPDLAPGVYTASVRHYEPTALLARYELTLTVGDAIAAPTGLGVSWDSGEAQLAWTAVVGATGYRVYYDDDPYEDVDGWIYYPSHVAAEGPPPLDASDAEFTVTGLPGAVEFTFAVTAINAHGESDYSEPVTVNGIPADAYEDDDDVALAGWIADAETQVRSLHTADDVDYVKFSLDDTTRISLTTDGPTAGDTNLWIYRVSETGSLGGFVVSDASDGWSNVVRELTSGTYAVRVQADHVYGSGRRAVAEYWLTFHHLTPPAAPTGVVATNPEAGVVEVTWHAVPQATSYRVHYDDDGDNPPYGTPWFAKVDGANAASPASTTGLSIRLTGIPPGTLYVAVSAVKDIAEGPVSAGASTPVE